MRSRVEELWERDDAFARSVRAVLSPAERVFAAIVARRNADYDAKAPARAPLPALSVGNLTVGGTGKTPVAAWCTQRLLKQGAHPAIVMRGYGDDEWRVHGLLTPNVPVIVAADRQHGMITARTRGADCAVLDDAFQHRRAARIADLVLLSADKWRESVRLLPAGPYREPMSALQRATVAVVTVKAAGQDIVAAVTRAIAAAAPAVPVSVVRLVPGSLRLAASLDSGVRRADPLLTHPPAWLAGRTIVALSAIGDPDAFESQLRGLGALLQHAVRLPDHHAYTASDAERVARLADGSSGVVCTLKDAVKLQAIWPREAPPLWYVSQSVVVDRGAEALDRAFARVLAARTATALTAG